MGGDMTFKKIILNGALLSLAMLGVVACTTIAKTEPVADMAHNSKNSLDWAGAYKGTMPCADCEGIDTVITLKQDGTYTSQTKYLGKGDDKVFTENGKFSWSEDGSTIMADGMRLKVGENHITWLDGDGKVITGDLAKMFVLQKIADTPLAETYWKLVEINGQPVKPTASEPYMILKADGSVNGSSGCNRMMGSYTAKDMGRISFGQMAVTKMFCMKDMETEQQFYNVLSQADNYTIVGDTLQLNKARMAPLAKFEAVYLR